MPSLALCALEKLPTKKEINVHDSLDEGHACKNFFGKSLSEAEQLFRDNSLYYQTDLKWMGPVAFSFYVQAAIAYVKTDSADGDAEIVSGLASTLELRLAYNHSELLDVATMLKDFCDYILNHWERFRIDPTESPIATTLEQIGMDKDLIFPEWRLNLQSRYERLRDRFQILKEFSPPSHKQAP